MFYVNINLSILAKLALNVPVVNEGFLRPIRRKTQVFHGRKKLWRSKMPQRRLRRLAFCVARAASSGGLSAKRTGAFTILLSAGFLILFFSNAFLNLLSSIPTEFENFLFRIFNNLLCKLYSYYISVLRIFYEMSEFSIIHM